LSPTELLWLSCQRTPSPSKQMSQPSSSKVRDRRDVKKLCSSQDPVKQNSRCALFQIIDYCNYFHYTHYVFTSRLVSILVLPITCGRTNKQLSPSLLMPWVISFILSCLLEDFHTSGTTILIEVLQLDQSLERALLSCHFEHPHGHYRDDSDAHVQPTFCPTAILL
jgi:hypothetical protein